MDNKELLKKLDRAKGLDRNYDETVFIGDITPLTAGRTAEGKDLIPDEVIQAGERELQQLQATNDLKNKTNITETINKEKTLEETTKVATEKKASAGLRLEVLDDQAIDEKGTKAHESKKEQEEQR